MAKKHTSNQTDHCAANCKNNHCTHAGGCVYLLGMIGAAVYYIQQAHGFWGVVLAILKAVVWPAFLVYKLLAH